MQVYGRLVIVEEEHLPFMPISFQKYARRYFREQTILGKKCLYAFRTINGDQSRGDFEKKPRGIAPTNCSFLREYSDGLGEGENLCNWIARNADVLPGLYELNEVWEDGRPYPEI